MIGTWVLYINLLILKLLFLYAIYFAISPGWNLGGEEC